MADINLSPYSAEQQAMDRRRKMAEAMQQQAVSPIEIPTTPGVKISPWQGLAKIFQGYLAGKNLSRSDQEQKDYENQVSGETANLLSNLGQYQTVPGEIIKPAQEARYEESVPIEENAQQKQALMDLYSPKPENAAAAAIGYKMLRPEDIARITNLPTHTEGRQIAAVPAEIGPSKQVPVLNASYLDPTKPNAYKTGQVRSMLAQYLMQQEAQKQAAAQAELAASRQIHKFSPEDTTGTIVNGVFKPIVTGTKQPKWEKSSTYDENGREITGWVNTNAPNIPASFVKGAVKPEMTKAQQVDMAIKLYGTRVEAQKAIDEGRVPLTFNLEELNIKPLPSKGTELQIGVMYDTPKGRLRWNGTKFTSVD